MRIQTFDFSVDLLKALQWQCNDASKLITLLQKKSEWYSENQTDFWENWNNDVFDLITANEFGLSVWSIILNLPLFEGEPPDPPDKPIFGFDDFNENFDNGNFANGGGINSLPLEMKRLLLRLRYFKLSSRASIPRTNAFLKLLFENQGEIYLLDGFNMSINLVFTFLPDRRLVDALQRFDLIPRLAGVKIKYVFTQIPYFGFDENNENFDNGGLQ